MRLDLVVGPNGAGKSTIVDLVLIPEHPDSIFVNADEIAKLRWPDSPEEHSYEAARIAADVRRKMIERRTPFIAETVFSHPSKLELVTAARDAGYYVALHAVLIPEDLSVRRVAGRASTGGHSVPEHKIRERYARLWSHVVTAIDLVDSAVVYDNVSEHGPRVVAQFVDGQLVGAADWPPWTPPALAALGADSDS